MADRTAYDPLSPGDHHLPPPHASACRLALLQAHCAVWPNTIQVSVYAPMCTSHRYMCLDEVATPDQLRAGSSWLGMLGLGLGRCQYSGWSLARLRTRVREAQKQAQATGACCAGQEQAWIPPSGVGGRSCMPGGCRVLTCTALSITCQHVAWYPAIPHCSKLSLLQNSPN